MRVGEESLTISSIKFGSTMFPAYFGTTQRELTPVNSTAVLIHWRILLALVGIVIPKNRSDFKSWGRDQLSQLEDKVKLHPVLVDREEEWTVIAECGVTRKTMR